MVPSVLNGGDINKPSEHLPQSLRRSSVQNVYKFLAHIKGVYSSAQGMNLFDKNAARDAGRFFVDRDLSRGELVTLATSRIHVIEENLSRLFALDNVEPTSIESYSSPTLHFGVTKDESMKELMDQNSRVVVKMYELHRSASKNGLADVVTDIVVSAAMGHLFLLAYEYVVSPHMAYALDWFVGPVMHVTERPVLQAPTIAFDDKRLAQYVIVERGDMTLFDALSISDISMAELRSILFQLLYTLEAAYDVAHYVHYDLHSSNVMLRTLYAEPASPYLDANWLYVRAQTHAAGPSHVVLTRHDHGNLFVEIIDNGRARAYCPLNPPEMQAKADTRQERALYGNPSYPGVGIHMADELLDRSWDMRRLFTHLMTSHNFMAGGSYAPTDPHEDDDMKELFAVGSNALFFLAYLKQKGAALRARFNTPEDVPVLDAFFDALQRDPLRAVDQAVLVERTVIPDRPLAVAVYNALAAIIFAKRSTFVLYVRSKFMDSTVHDMYDQRNGGSALSSRHLTLTASLCMGLPIFSRLAATPALGDNVVLVGLVNAQATRWANVRDPKAPGAASFAAFENIPSAPLECTTCGRPACGYLVQDKAVRDAKTPHLAEHAVCGVTCMHIRTGAIAAARPY